MQMCIRRSIMYKTRDIAEFIVLLIEQFGRRYSLSLPEAESYLSQYGALKLILQHYGIMHTLSQADNIEALTIYCQRKGGHIK